MSIEDVAINIIVSDVPDESGMYFVEIENDKGESITIGEWTQTDYGFNKIRITTYDIINNEKT